MVGDGYLLDTNAFVWSGIVPARLSRQARKILTDSSSVLNLSICSVWEMQIKHGLGKLPLPDQADRVAQLVLESIKGRILEIKTEHIGMLYSLPPVHRDPFDRMLAAQAKAEGLHIVSPDPVFGSYGVPVIW